MPRGGYRNPKGMKAAEEEFFQWREERRKVREAEEASQPPKVGINPNQPWHPLFNPTPEEIEQRKQSEIESWKRWKAEKLRPSQEQHWKKAIQLIRERRYQSYAALGQHFARSAYDQRRGAGETYTAKWAYYLVRKMIVRKIFTEDEIQRLIPDQDRSFMKRRRRPISSLQ